MATIDLITFVYKGINPYVELMKKSAKFFASKNHQIYFKGIQSGVIGDIPKGILIVDNTPIAHPCGSYNHGLAINKSLEHITSDYAVIIDADICLLYPNWDEVVIKELEQYDCFGLNRVRENFPSVFMFCFKRSLLGKVKLDFLPVIRKHKESPPKYKITTELEAKQRRMRVGRIIKCDTGYMLPVIMNGNGLGLPAVSWTRKSRLLKKLTGNQVELFRDKTEHMCEWHYDNKLFATHKQACRAHPLNSEWGKVWKHRIDLYTDKNFNIIL